MQKEVKKLKKSCEKVLTFRRNDDNINKLAREAQAKRRALNLENDTEKKEAQSTKTVIPTS